LLRQFEALKDLAESRRIDLRNVRSQVIHAMHAIQSVRRLLRVHSTKEGETVRILNASRWFELIEKLNESQLEIERLRRVHLLQIASGPVDAKVLGANLKQIDDYIRALLREFEALDGLDEPILNLAGSPKVSEFLFAELPPKYVQAFSAIEASFVEEAMRLGPLNTLKS